jgi:hypothetical protein
MLKRTDEKLHRLEVMAMQIAESKTAQVRDKLEAMRFLVQIYEDETSLFLYGPSHFLVKDAASAPSVSRGSEKRFYARDDHAPWPWGVDDIEEDIEDDDADTAVF